MAAMLKSFVDVSGKDCLVVLRIRKLFWRLHVGKRAWLKLILYYAFSKTCLKFRFPNQLYFKSIKWPFSVASASFSLRRAFVHLIGCCCGEVAMLFRRLNSRQFLEPHRRPSES